MDLRLLLIVSILVASSSQVPEIETLYTNGPGTSEYFPLHESLIDGNTLIFSVRTSRDAHILFATSPQRDQPEYEIILGAVNNTINYIRGRYPDENEPSSAVRTVNLLNQQEFRDLWIRLNNDPRKKSVTVQVGIGEENLPFQEWRDTTPLTPMYLSFRSETLANWRYGYSDWGHTIGVPDHKKRAFVTVEKNGLKYGQYHPISEIMSHSNDNTSTIYFIVQTAYEFQILLGPRASSSGSLYEFGLKPTSVYVRRQQADNNGHSTSSAQNNAEVEISNDSSKKQYWIKVNKDGQMTMGRGGSAEPILSWRDPDPIFPQFVAFSLVKGVGNYNPANYAEIEYGLGPDYKLESQDCETRWKDALNQQLPPGAVKGGYNDKAELFICRAAHQEAYLPGSFTPGDDNKGECQVAYNVNVHKKTEFQVLTGCHFAWVAASLGEVPDDAVLAGEYPSKTKVHVARVTHENQVLIGKLHTSEATAYVAFNNQELPFTHYEILVKYEKD